jgi:3-methylcrotonyl-CoA carboxylase alpha subunit
MMFKKILVANRGEIALRVMLTCKEMGIRTVSIYTDSERDLPHATMADESICLGSGPLSKTYLNKEKIIAQAKKVGAQAIHPGYGFLSENGEFARQVRERGLIFIGPSSEHLDLMGDKIRCKSTLEKMGVPFLSGYHGDNQDTDYLFERALEIGFPLLIKASAGGGGKGMRIVESEKEFFTSLESARTEALNTFGNDRVLLEKYLLAPRHIEVQVMGDGQGNYLHFFERECSIQRRHQKIIEETPAPHLPWEVKQKLFSTSVRIIKEIGYLGAGTIEFLYNESTEAFYFLEMNTRLQVEHPVTEMVTHHDLVRLQILVASGESLTLKQEDIQQTGHGIEVRLYAEDPDKNYLPSWGKISHVALPSLKNVRFDSGYVSGNKVSVDFDSLLAKVISWGENREIARQKMIYTLNEMSFLGVKTNREFLQRILQTSQFSSGEIATNFIEKNRQVLEAHDLTSEELALSILAFHISQDSSKQGPGDDCWDDLRGFRNV